jgi:succinoglycan biosynthesis transport protein ExoP
MAQQLLAISDTTVQAGAWLQSRIGELRGQAVAADQAVQEYKARHNIADVTTGAGTGLMDEQQLGELNVELATARARTAAAQGQYEQAQAETAGDLTSATALNPVMASLQQQYLDAVRTQAGLISRLGPNHGAVHLQAKVVAALQQSIRTEMALQVAGDRADLAAATANQAAIQTRLKEEIAAEAQTNIQLSELTSLQSSATAYRDIYQNFLQRYTQAIQDQSYPIANARVAAAALPPPARSSPHRAIALACGLLAGLALGVLLAVLREALDVSVRTTAQLHQATGLDILGSIADSPALTWHPAAQADKNVGSDHLRVPTIFRDAARNPASALADAVQSVRAAAARQSARGRNVQIIGCVSVAPQEGCSTFAANLAFVLAADGQRTALVDWNARSPGLSEMFAAQPDRGPSALLTTAQTDSLTKLSFFGQPAGAPAGAQPGPAKIQATLAALRETYDIIILDLPPLQTSSTAIQFSDWIDGFVLITRYGTTSKTALTEALAFPASTNAVFLGAILNRRPAAPVTFNRPTSPRETSVGRKSKRRVGCAPATVQTPQT